jgi:hypothetical protein
MKYESLQLPFILYFMNQPEFRSLQQYPAEATVRLHGQRHLEFDGIGAMILLLPDELAPQAHSEVQRCSVCVAGLGPK